MVFYLKDSHVNIRCDNAPSCKFVYSVTKNDKVNKGSKEKHAIIPYIDFEHIKGRGNILADSLPRLKNLDLNEANDPKELGSEYGKSIFETDSEIVCGVHISQHSNREFEIKCIKYIIDEKDLDDFPSHGTDAHSSDPNPSLFKCNLDMKRWNNKDRKIHISLK